MKILYSSFRLSISFILRFVFKSFIKHSDEHHADIVMYIELKILMSPLLEI